MSFLRHLQNPVEQRIKRALDFTRWTPAAWREVLRDRLHGLYVDPGPQAAIDSGLKWITTAQDHSASHDGGVARHYSLLSGWSTSYPETTGYIIPTLLSHSLRRGDEQLTARARRALPASQAEGPAIRCARRRFGQIV